MGLNALPIKLLMETFSVRRQVPSLGFCHTDSLEAAILTTRPAVGTSQDCLLSPLCFSALNILEAGGLQIALLEKADRKPCQFYFTCSS